MSFASVRTWLSKVMTFHGWMAIAEIIDALRIFPRLVLTGYLAYSAYFCLRILQFYFDLPAEQRTTEVTLFCGAVIAVVTGIGTKVFDLYNNSGRDWATYHAERKIGVATFTTGDQR